MNFTQLCGWRNTLKKYLFHKNKLNFDLWFGFCLRHEHDVVPNISAYYNDTCYSHLKYIKNGLNWMQLILIQHHICHSTWWYQSIWKVVLSATKSIDTQQDVTLIYSVGKDPYDLVLVQTKVNPFIHSSLDIILHAALNDIISLE